MILSYKGLCLVPIKVLGHASGRVCDINQNPLLPEILRFAEQKNLAVMYLSYIHGLVYYDTFLTDEGTGQRPTQVQSWTRLVAEQLYRECLELSVTRIFYMGNYTRGIDIYLKYSIINCGLRFDSPLSGMKVREAKEFLRAMI